MPQRKQTTYNKILKQFTKINSKLPEERKLSIQERRRIIKEKILPKFRGKSVYQVRITDVKTRILREVQRVPPREICNLNYLDLAEFQYVEWFALDETISELVPDCVYVKVSAGEWGDTNIFNTRNYQYGRNGVRRVVEAIRPDAENESGRYVFTAVRKLRPRKVNDGSAENYYLDFILNLVSRSGSADPQGDMDQVTFNLPRTRDTRKKKAKISNIIEQRIRSLKAKRDSKKRAKRTLDRNIGDYLKAEKGLKKLKRPNQDKAKSVNKKYSHALKQLEKYYKEGKLTTYQYDQRKAKLKRDEEEGS